MNYEYEQHSVKITRIVSGIDSWKNLELKGLEILSKGDQIKRIDPDTYRVNSQNGNGSYLVQAANGQNPHFNETELNESFMNIFLG
jgi:hypothetical protein